MHSLLAGWRLSLRRTRADWPIVAAAWLIIILATVLFAAGPPGTQWVRSGYAAEQKPA